MSLKRIIYCSHATVSMDNALNLSEILGASARNNRRDEITGVLAFADGIFIQAIEGPQHAADGLMTRLRTDARHRDVKVLGEDRAVARAFPIWVMETPKIRPDHTALLHKIVGGCESSYGHALKMMLELAREHEDQKQRA